jgi:hypothetical protein
VNAIYCTMVSTNTLVSDVRDGFDADDRSHLSAARENGLWHKFRDRLMSIRLAVHGGNHCGVAAHPVRVRPDQVRLTNVRVKIEVSSSRFAGSIATGRVSEGDVR